MHYQMEMPWKMLVRGSGFRQRLVPSWQRSKMQKPLCGRKTTLHACRAIGERRGARGGEGRGRDRVQGHKARLTF